MFLFRFSIANYYSIYLIYMVELFPARVVGLSVSICNLSADLSSAAATIMLGGLERI